MRVPRALKRADEHGVAVRTHEYDDESVIAVDFGTAHDVSFDVVGDTVIVLADGEQFEFELPEDASDVTAKHGVLTITD